MSSSTRCTLASVLLCLGLAGTLQANFTFTSGTPPNAAVNTAYSFVFTAQDNSCDVPNFVFSSTDKPSWLSLTSAGALTSANGPAISGPYAFHVTVSDSCPESTPVQNSYTITVSAPGEYYYVVPVLSPPNPLTIQAVNGGTTVTCAYYSETDPCYGYYAIQDLTVDSNGNFIVLALPNTIFRLPAPGSSPPTPLVSTAQIPPDTTLGSTAASSANFISFAVDAGGNYIVLDSGNNAVWFFPMSGGTGQLVGLTNIAPMTGGSVIRIDGSGNYVVAVSQQDSNLNPEIQVAQYTGCSVEGSCPATQAANSLLTGAENTSNGPIEGQLDGLAIVGGEYYISNLGDSNFPTPSIAKVSPAGPTVGLFFSDPNRVTEPGPIVYDSQTGNVLVVDEVYGLDAISNDGTGVEQIYRQESGYYYVGAAVTSQPAQASQPSGPTTAPIPPLILSGGPLPSAFADEPYSAGVSASGGEPPYTFSASGLPAGISLNPYSGAIAGQTTQTGNFTIAISVTDSRGVSSGSAFSLTVSAPPPVSLSGTSLGSVLVGTPLSTIISASGGAPPYTYALAAGALPAGLNLSPGGSLSGTPLRAGSYSFLVRATDSAGGSATGSFTISILPPPLTITSPSPLATGMVSVVYPQQTLSATGGTAPYTFAVTNGSLPTGLTLSTTGSITGTPSAPTAAGGGSFTVTATDSSTPASTGTATLSLTVQPFSANLILSSGSASFSLSAGSQQLPPAQNVQVASSVVNRPLGYTVTVNPPSATWLSAGPGGSTPGSISIALTNAALSLAASTTPYTANVAVACAESSPCAGSSQTVSVSLSVTNPPPLLSVATTPLSFNTLSSAPQTTTESLTISNAGGGSIGFASIACGAPWCTVGGVPASLGPGGSASVSVTANPAGLGSGYYYTAVTLVTSAGSASVPVTLNIAPNGLMSLAPAGAAFTVPQGGALTGGDSFLVDISGPTPNAFGSAVQPGAPWLAVSNGNGTASGTSPASVSYSFNNSVVAGLAPGVYYAQIGVTAAGASNSPQSFEVVLNVTPPTTPTTPSLVPGGLIFLTQATATPPAQTVTVNSSSPNSTAFQAAAATNSGGNWLSVSPSTGNTSSASPAVTSVSVNPSGLSPGVYTGSVSYAFGTAVRSVNVTLVVENASSSTTPAISSRGGRSDAAGACTPSQLVPTSTALVSNFSAPAAWPVELAITLVDDCGDIVSNGEVVTTFSNGDPPLILSLADPVAGNYVATWTPEHASSQITINARATAPSLSAATRQIAGAVTPNNAPILADLAVANFYNPIGGAPLAPGTLIQISGQYLAGQTLNATTIPLPQTLGGTSVIVGGVQAPVSMVSPGQVNAQVPFELPPGQPYQVIVNANTALTTPQSFQAGAASPGLSVLPNGYVQASHQSGAAVTESAPAKPGENISIYLVGMGATTIAVASGQPGPSATLAATVVNPAVAVNKEPAEVTFSGLVPGLVGVYQVNFAVPADAPNGDLTLTLTQNAFGSNTGLLPVHN